MTHEVQKVRFLQGAVVEGPSYSLGEGAAFRSDLAHDLVERGIVELDQQTNGHVETVAIEHAHDKMVRPKVDRKQTHWSQGPNAESIRQRIAETKQAKRRQVFS